ncbi:EMBRYOGENESIS ABUNDANT PROTEIN GROUP 8 PROTEIN putative-RELATED [Salix koriyanagi]|uniref:EMBRYOGENESIS ABUNDANT PROTEIN GROUP 8 PROTEIN putative-RELATED n=1 Tax=Salix koriyanagi TaxID=2511006 RepID=A0A9Q0TC24_9ROSI|nr:EMBRYOGENESIS ABUNDANT PROTEIN GROUP 8 PROTEIN putative-RELATED [Salix koriyanagi]
MESNSKQMENRKEGVEEKKGKLDGLPMESSPYLKYTDLEDYKRMAYGTEGHQEVKPNQGGGGTDAPTLSGKDLSPGKNGDNRCSQSSWHSINQRSCYN